MKKHDEGYVMLLVVVVILVLSIVSAALMSMTVANLKNQRNSVNRMKEKYSAQGALEKQLATIAAGLKEEPPAEIEVKYQNNKEKLDAAVADTYTLPGIYYIRTWLAEGRLQVGDDIMYVLIGGDIRPHVMEALDYLVDRIKKECVSEKEIFG